MKEPTVTMPVSLYNAVEARIKELETENKSLRDALSIIGNRDKDCDGRCRPQARKALEKDDG